MLSHIVLYLYFYTYFFNKMTWGKKKKHEREAASFPLHRLLLRFLSRRVLFKTYSWEEPMHLNFMTAVQLRTTKTTSSTGTSSLHFGSMRLPWLVTKMLIFLFFFSFFPPIWYRLDMTRMYKQEKEKIIISPCIQSSDSGLIPVWK